MEDKKQDVNSLKELVKTANSYSGFFANLADELSKVLADVEAPDEEEDTWEMKCPYNYNDSYYYISVSGNVSNDCWCDFEGEKESFEAGNIFKTKKAAELESKRRNLLTRFRAFRDECNGNWKPNWSNKDEVKAYIQYYVRFKRFVIKQTTNCDMLQTFGFFKRKQDAQRAIDLFGDEIIELFVNCEGGNDGLDIQ